MHPSANCLSDFLLDILQLINTSLVVEAQNRTQYFSYGPHGCSEKEITLPSLGIYDLVRTQLGTQHPRVGELRDKVLLPCSCLFPFLLLSPFLCTRFIEKTEEIIK